MTTFRKLPSRAPNARVSVVDKSMLCCLSFGLHPSKECAQNYVADVLGLLFVIARSEKSLVCTVHFQKLAVDMSTLYSPLNYLFLP